MFSSNSCIVLCDLIYFYFYKVWEVFCSAPATITKRINVMLHGTFQQQAKMSVTETENSARLTKHKILKTFLF